MTNRDGPSGGRSDSRLSLCGNQCGAHQNQPAGPAEAVAWNRVILLSELLVLPFFLEKIFGNQQFEIPIQINHLFTEISEQPKNSF